MYLNASCASSAANQKSKRYIRVPGAIYVCQALAHDTFFSLFGYLSAVGSVVNDTIINVCDRKNPGRHL